MKLIAQNVDTIFGKVTPPRELQPYFAKGGDGGGGLTLFLSNLVMLVYTISFIFFILYIIWGGWSILTSGGDKEALAGARKRIMFALVGMVLLAVAFPLIAIIGHFLGIKIFAAQNFYNIPNAILGI